MAQANYTPIQLYRSTTASAVPTSGNLADGELAINTNDGKLYYKDSGGTVQLIASKAGASGDVVGPASATDNAIVRFDGTTGKLVQNSVVTIADSTGDISGVGQLNATTVDATNVEVTNIKAKDGTAAATIADSTGVVSITANPILSGGTANGVLYLNGSKVATSGSAVTYNGTTFSTSADASVNGLTVGRGAGAVSTNTAVGASALNSNSTGAQNTAIGNQAGATTNAAYLTAVGYQAARYNTGDGNTAIGTNALLVSGGTNGTGTNNVAVGKDALYSNTTASNNTAVGYQAGYSNTTGVIDAFGNQALRANTTGTNNTGIGNGALFSNTTGGGNIAMGNSAALLNTTGSNNTALGLSALYSNTTASNNTAVGYQALYSQGAPSAANSAFGYQAGYSITTGIQNTCIGTESGRAVTTGQQNTFLGHGSGYYMTTGSKNTIVGKYDGNQGGLDIRTASNYCVISDGDGNPRGIFDNNGNFLVGTTSGSNRLTVSSTANDYISRMYNTNATGADMLYMQSTADPNDTVYKTIYALSNATARFYVQSNGGIGNYQANNVNLSDLREKTNFAPAKSYLDTICAIPVQTFNYIDQNMEKDGGLTLGVVAQDVQAVAPELVMESNWGTEEDPKMRLSIYQTDLQYALMKALQELKAEFDAYKAAHP